MSVRRKGLGGDALPLLMWPHGELHLLACHLCKHMHLALLPFITNNDIAANACWLSAHGR